jgi:hypothetical protein
MNERAGRNRGRTWHEITVARGGAILVAIIVGMMTGGTPVHGQTVAPAAQGSPRDDGAKAPSANDRALEPGPEERQLARRVGTWNVVMTIRPTADARPIVVKGMVAERTMVGLYLQETMRPASGSNLPDFRRIAYLTYNKVEGRWQYTSMDTRAPIGIMFAKSYGNEHDRDITTYFEGFALPGFGPQVEGRFIRARHVVKLEGDDHDLAEQYWIPVAGSEWLAVQYDFTRKR